MSMGLKRIRCVKGKTITDVSKEVGIEKEYLRGFENGRRQLEIEDIQKLSKCYNQDVNKIYDAIASMRKENERDIESMSVAVSKFGYFPNAYNSNETKIRAFLYFINDLWEEFNKKCFEYIEDTPNDIDKKILEFKYSLLKEETIKYKTFKPEPNAFIYTYNIDYCPKQCWIEIYNEDETEDGCWLMLIKNFGGDTLAYDFPEDFKALVLNIKKRMRDSKKNLRIFHYYPDKYLEIDEYGEPLFNNTSPKIKDYIENRLYRKLVKAKELPRISFYSDSDCRCKDNKKGLCPMKSDIIPNEDNGCSYCRGIMKSWEAREFIIEKITDEEFRSLKSFHEFKEDHPEYGKIFLDKYKNESVQIYEYAYKFSNYQLYASDNIKISNGGDYENGRHRTKIAKNMDIVIPVLFSNYEKSDEELIEC